MNTENQTNDKSPVGSTAGVGGKWRWLSWIANPPHPWCESTFMELVHKGRLSDHGECRMVRIRPDGTGADCYILDEA